MIYSYKIEQAVRAAGILHSGQIRRGSIPYPYITHPFSVALILADYTDDEDVIAAGLLHDVLEDTNYTASELGKDFGERIRRIVEGVTDAPFADRSQYSWQERQVRYYEALGRAPDESLLVGAADKIHNMRTIIEEYDDRPTEYISDFGESTREHVKKYARLHEIFNSRIKNAIIDEFNLVHEKYVHFLDGIDNTLKKRNKNEKRKK